MECGFMSLSRSSFLHPMLSVAAIENGSFCAANGGVAATIPFSLDCDLIFCATNHGRPSGLLSSPMLSCADGAFSGDGPASLLIYLLGCSMLFELPHVL
eukprot:846297-Pyramimonas_sp.AAC.1